MVTWQTTVKLAFEIAREKGAEFDGIEDGAEFVSDLSKWWNVNGDDVRQLTEEQTRRLLEKVVSA